MYTHNTIYRSDIERIFDASFSEFTGKTFLITGASGLVGSCVVDVLMYLNDKYNYNIMVFAVFSNRCSMESRFPSYRNRNDFTAIIHDITLPFDYDIAADFIIHAASNTHPHLYASAPVETIKLNVLGTLNVMAMSRKRPYSKILFLSTLEVYGEKDIDHFSEPDIGFIDFTAVRSCYPESKRICETLCRSFAEEYASDVVIARLGYVYGPTVKTDSTKADVQFLNAALRGAPIIMKSRGLQCRSYIYVFDVVSAVLTLLLKGVSGEAYNIAAESGNRLLKDFATVISQLSCTTIKFEAPTEKEKQGYSTVTNSVLNSTKLLSLGWKPQFSFEEGIRHTYEIKLALKKSEG